MVSIGLDVSGQSLVVDAVNERKPRGGEGEPSAPRAGLRALRRQVGTGGKRVPFEAGTQRKWIAEALKTLPDVQVQVVQPSEGTWGTASRGKTERVAAKQVAELARAGGFCAPCTGAAGGGSARPQLQRKRVALINTRRGAVDQAGHWLSEKFLVGPTGAAKLARLLVRAPLRLLRETFLPSIEARRAAEQRLTVWLEAIEDSRCLLRESIPASGPVAARVLASALFWRACSIRPAAVTLSRPWRAMAPWSRRVIRAGRPGHLGGSIAMGAARASASGEHAPRRWYA